MIVDIYSLPVDQQQKALVWQCRRGIKEIEVLLIPFLEHYYVHEDEQTRQAFIALLAEADLDIFEWFMHRQIPENKQMEEIVDVILQRLAVKL
jgi:antitoxin CptB